MALGKPFSRTSPAVAVAQHVALARQQLADLAAIVDTLAAEPTWPVAGSLGHITESLETMIAGFSTLRSDADAVQAAIADGRVIRTDRDVDTFTMFPTAADARDAVARCRAIGLDAEIVTVQS
jgi:hypothetical protein